jgi:hypothetical protein
MKNEIQMTKELFEAYASREIKLHPDMVLYPMYGIVELKTETGYTFWWIQDSLNSYHAPHKDTKILESWKGSRPHADELPPIMRGNNVLYELHQLEMEKSDGTDTLGLPGYIVFLSGDNERYSQGIIRVQ